MSSACQRSIFARAPSLRFQLRFFQPGSQMVRAVHQVAGICHECHRNSPRRVNPICSAAVNSMRLLVVSFSPPFSTRSTPCAKRSTAAHPPGPGVAPASAVTVDSHFRQLSRHCPLQPVPRASRPGFLKPWEYTPDRADMPCAMHLYQHNPGKRPIFAFWANLGAPLLAER